MLFLFLFDDVKNDPKIDYLIDCILPSVPVYVWKGNIQSSYRVHIYLSSYR